MQYNEGSSHAHNNFLLANAVLICTIHSSGKMRRRFIFFAATLPLMPRIGTQRRGFLRDTRAAYEGVEYSVLCFFFRGEDISFDIMPFV